VTPGGRGERGLVLDLQAVQSADHAERGIARYAVELTRALMAEPGGVRAILLNPNLSRPTRLPADLSSGGLLVENDMAGYRRLAERGPLTYVVLSPMELQRPAEEILPPHVVDHNPPVAVVTYDVIPFLMPERYLSVESVRRRYYGRLELLRRADLLLAISEHTRRDVLKLLDLPPERVAAIGAGVSGFFRRQEGAMGRVVEALPEIRGPFVLSVSGDDPRKNNDTLIRAWSMVSPRLRATHQLVIACKLRPGTAEAWKQQAAALGLEPRDLVLTDHVSDELLRDLYSSARLFVFASLYEGFGLPVAEAISCGCPAISANTSSLPEVVDLREGSFDPLDPSAIAAMIERGLLDEGFRAVLLAAAAARSGTHTWEAVGRRAAAALRGLDVSPRMARSRRRLRVALCAPAPPAHTGIAVYVERLLPALLEHADVDLLIAPGGRRSLVPRRAGLRRFPLAALGRTLNPASYGGIVHTFGNHDAWHASMAPYVLAYPGLLWLHDARLVEYHLNQARGLGREGGRAWMSTRLRQMYGESVGDAVTVDAWDDPATYHRQGIGLTPELVGASRGVLVNSRLAASMIEEDLARAGVEVSAPIVLPFGIPRLPAVGQRNAVVPVIVSLGFVAAVKAPVLLIEALAEVRRTIPGAILVLAGTVAEDLRSELERVAAALGVGAAVQLPGHVDDATYQDLLGKASCAVQLRTWSLGESSAAVADAIGAGVPVITNVRACEELPHGSVRYLDALPAAPSLAREIVALVNDGPRREEQLMLAAAHAEANGFEAVASALVRAVAIFGNHAG
jgi:glycosyltransferase involved in cell wall biosynthesis